MEAANDGILDLTAAGSAPQGSICRMAGNQIAGKWLLSIIFVVMISAPLVALIFQGEDDRRDNERFERRPLAAAPAIRDLSDLKTLPELFDLWFADRFGFRLPLVKLQSRLRFELFGVAPRENILVGRDGWFFQGRGSQRIRGSEIAEYDVVTDLLGKVPFSEGELKRWKQVLEERNAYLKSRGIPYVFALAPSKALIYPEYLPPALARQRGLTRLEQLQEYLQRESSVPIVDLVAALRQAKKELGHSVPLYLKTDGHWNEVGAFFAYRAIMKKVAQLLPNSEVKIMAYEDFTLRYKRHWFHPGFASQMGFPIIEPFPFLAPLKGSLLDDVFYPGAVVKERSALGEQSRAIGSAPLDRAQKKGVSRVTGVKLVDSTGESARFTYAHNFGDPELETILIMGDSFIRKGFKFFAAHSRDLYRKRTDLEFSTLFLKIEDSTVQTPQVVIQEVCQGYIGRNPPVNPPDIGGQSSETN
jgi:hypothetical protein